jgi:hypothetical protein
MCINISNILSRLNGAHTDKRMQREVELQLHEQYAINNNANLGSVITFMVSIITVVGLYAYTFAHTTLEFSNPPLVEMYDSSCDMYSFDCLFFLAAGVICVLTIIQYICLYQGSQQRYEQFITHAIRCKYFGPNFLHSQRPKVFPEDYSPFNKKLNAFVQGLYGEFVRIVSVLKFIIVLTIFIKLIYVLCLCGSSYSTTRFTCSGLCSTIVLIIVSCSAPCCVRCMRCKRYFKYISLCNEFKDCHNRKSIRPLLENLRDKNCKRLICPICNSMMKVFHCKHRCLWNLMTHAKQR